MAILEAKVLTVLIWRRFNVRIVPGQDLSYR